MKYTKEMLEPLVKKNISVAGVLRDLGRRQVGSIHTHLSKTIRKLGIDASHFTGQASNAGALHKGGPGKTPWQQILVNQPLRERRQDAFRLRRALLESGRLYQCEGDGCTIVTVWLGKPIRLQVDHINGDWRDNRPKNLRFLCPNCHCQTPGHSGDLGNTGLTSIREGARKRRLRRKQEKSGRGGMADPPG